MAKPVAKHRYPRRWVFLDGTRKRESYDAIEVHAKGSRSENLILTCSGAVKERHEGALLEDGIEKNFDKWGMIETFDHHEQNDLEAQFRGRQAIVYLKSLVKQQREEISQLRQELADAKRA